MKKTFFAFGLAFILLVVSSLFVSQNGIVYSLSPEEQYQENQKEIQELEKKVAELEKQEKTLASQIAYMDSQIKLTLLKISQTEEEIVMLTSKISRLEVSLDFLSEALGKRIVATYKKADFDNFAMFLSSGGFSEYVTRSKYLKAVQIHDRKLLITMEETRTNYDDQKKEVETLKTKLESQKKLLGKQKNDKEYLLTTTKADEQKFREMLASARAEQAAIEKILAGLGNVSKIGPVKAGEAIGSYAVYDRANNPGVSGCSSGSHLHFEVVKDNNRQNPVGYLKNISLMFEDRVERFTPSGSWDWPIVEPVRITQEYGSTFWSRLGYYSGGPHTGVDMVSGAFGSPGPRNVKAVADGTLNRGSISCGGNTSLKYARVDQADGIQTYYLHLN